MQTFLFFIFFSVARLSRNHNVYNNVWVITATRKKWWENEGRLCNRWIICLVDDSLKLTWFLSVFIWHTFPRTSSISNKEEMEYHSNLCISIQCQGYLQKFNNWAYHSFFVFHFESLTRRQRSQINHGVFKPSSIIISHGEQIYQSLLIPKKTPFQMNLFTMSCIKCNTRMLMLTLKIQA